MKYYSYLNSAKSILQSYKGDQPFGIFVKDFFRQHKKYGSKDRKHISHLCYCYFRTGKLLNTYSQDEAITAALFLCSTSSNEMLQHLNAGLNDKASFDIEEKCDLLGVNITDAFPWTAELSTGIDHKKFCASLLVQPDLFLRIRPGYQNGVIEKLEKNGITFELDEHCIRMLNSTKIDEILSTDVEVVIQDYNSQQVGKTFANVVPGIRSAEKPGHPNKKMPAVWDCCAASGGKSIMMYDLFPAMRLTVSDVRKSILINLEKRFEKAGINKYRSFVADLAGSKPITGESYDLIIADVPCSGSGTWGRVPEQLFFFESPTIDRYSQLQQKILKNIIPSLSDRGKLIYITCSVFKKENEMMIEYLQQESSLQLESISLLPGYEIKADSLFVAVLGKTN